MNYRPEIDGLRTVAVTAVIIFHLNSYFLKGGFYGVDVFFVISGYLITSILIKNIEEGNFSMLNFWIRRVKRLIPLLLTVVIAVLIIVPQLVFKPLFKDVLSDVFPAVFSYFNLHAYFNFGDYWGRGAENSYFLHTWSLSVEEQFYLFYPAFLIISYKYFKNFLKPLIILTSLSLLAFLLLVKINRDLTFYMLPTRLWELSAGGILSCLPIKFIKNRFVKNGLPLAGLSFIVISYFFSKPTLDYYVLLPVTGTVLIIYFCRPEDMLGKILSAPIFTFTGKLSYALYLWHWPVIVLFKNRAFQLQDWSNLQKYISIITITFILSFISYTLIEKKAKNYKHTPKIVLSGITAVILLIFYFKSDVFDIHYPARFNKVSYHLKYYDISPTQIRIEEDHPLIYNINKPERPDSLSSSYKKEGFIRRIDGHDPEIMLLGDSHAVMWAKIIDEISERKRISRSFYAANASEPFVSLSEIGNQVANPYFTEKERADYARSLISNIKKWKPEKVVIACKWSSLHENDYKLFEEMLVFLGQQGTEVMVINQPPVLTFFEDQNASQYFTYLGIQPVRGFKSVYIGEDPAGRANKNLEKFSKKYRFLKIIDIYHDMYARGKAKILYNNDVLYFDDDHLSYAGTKIHLQKLEKYIAEQVWITD